MCASDGVGSDWLGRGFGFSCSEGSGGSSACMLLRCVLGRVVTFHVKRHHAPESRRDLRLCYLLAVILGQHM